MSHGSAEHGLHAHAFRAPRLYDLGASILFLGRRRATFQTLIAAVGVRAGQRVLDVGCGTGTLAVLIKKLHPQVDVFGLDPDPRALERARHKAQRTGVALRFDQGFSTALPYDAATFDHVFSTYMFHHLEKDDKAATLREVRRVLKPGGRLHLMDFAGPDEGGHSVSRLFHAHDRMKDNARSRILELMAQAGLESPREAGERRVLLGLAKVAYYEAAA